MTTMTVRQRVAAALTVYAGLVTAACIVFPLVRQGTPVAPYISYLYALFGPALALFTHMGYFLFVLQSGLLLPWLLLGAIRVQRMRLSAAVFVIGWLAIGWYMHELF